MDINHRISTQKIQASIWNSSREIQTSKVQLCLFLQDRQTGGINIYKVDTHISEESAQKKSDLHLNEWPRKSRFPPKRI